MATMAVGMTGPVIFTTREDIETPCGGSSIRVAGYTSYLEDLGVDYSFVAPVRPAYVPEDRFLAIERDKALYRLIYAYLAFSGLFFAGKRLQKIIDRHPLIQSMLRLTKNRIVWVHQTGLIPLYLAIAHNRRYIYDVHGILKIQREYFDHATLQQKTGLILNVWLEKKFFRHATFVNAASLKMKQFIADAFKIEGDSIIITPEGLLENNFTPPSPVELSALQANHRLTATDRVIFFAGDFKKIGGVHLLTDVFCKVAPSMDNLKLFLVGSGQMEGYVLDTIRRHNLESRLIHLRRVDYARLPQLQQLSTIIVCPDLYNRYNEMVAHIKVFDSLGAQKPVLASRFPVLLEEFPESKGCILYFEPSDPGDLERAIRQGLEQPHAIRPLSNEELRLLTYRQRVKGVINEYRRREIIHD
jgi:glycosyltransferase involved in cell wall biosynthesis